MNIGRRRLALGSSVLVFAIIVGLLAAGIGIASLMVASSPTPSPSTSTTLTTYTTPGTPTENATSSVTSPNGLRLTLSLAYDPSSFGSGIPIEVSLFNTLSTTSNLEPTAGAQEFSLGPCSQLPLGVEVLEGNYGLGNLSEGSSLGLYYPGVYNCPALFGVAYWSFAPHSDNVTLLSQQPVGNSNTTAPQAMWTQKASASLEYWGYWSGEAPEGYPTGNASFTSFPPDVYTVAADDSWGQVTLLHFTVVPVLISLPSCSSIASDPSYLRYANFSSSGGPLNLQAYYREAGSNTSYVLALSASGNLTVSLTYLDYSGNWPLQFSANSSQIQTWQFFTPEGALAYPATFQHGQCSLLQVNLPYPSQSIVLGMELSDNETQTFTLNA
ncbi:MAG: hypothetical protein JRN09_00140 [Nitrososphaerota archaeon]|nr:hypothetical protein [Nitrososphaerota archaeon]